MAQVWSHIVPRWHTFDVMTEDDSLHMIRPFNGFQISNGVGIGVAGSLDASNRYSRERCVRLAGLAGNEQTRLGC